jgi:hypothetical protein
MMVLGGIVSRCFSDFDLAGFGRACVLCAQRESERVSSEVLT